MCSSNPLLRRYLWAPRYTETLFSAVVESKPRVTERRRIDMRLARSSGNRGMLDLRVSQGRTCVAVSLMREVEIRVVQGRA